LWVFFWFFSCFFYLFLFVFVNPHHPPHIRIPSPGRGFIITLLGSATMKLAGPACLAVPTTLRG